METTTMQSFNNHASITSEKKEHQNFVSHGQSHSQVASWTDGQTLIIT